MSTPSLEMTSYQDHDAKVQRVVAAFKRQKADVRLQKDTSNLFRMRQPMATARLDVRHLSNVIHVNPDEGWVDVEGMTTYADLVDATLHYGVMPAVVPQLKSITIGGAVSGIGIESTSFRYGLPHETVISMDILTGDGRVITATPTGDMQDLYLAFPNSYGTLGYALKLRVATVPVKPFVKLSHQRFDNNVAYFDALESASNDALNDFVDGVVFDATNIVLTTGRFVDDVPWTSDYTWMKMYFRSLQTKTEDYLRTHDYLWRWDTDWFWCSKNVFAQNPVVRLLAGRRFLNSITYQKIMRFNNRWGLMQRVNRIRNIESESVIQDVDIPIENAGRFLDFFHDEIGIKPVWTCPIRSPDPDRHFDLYPLDPNNLYINFGFWDVIRGREKHPVGYFNRKIEAKVTELGGIKSLYSDSYYTESDFWKIYHGASYHACKDKYDPHARFKNLYEKCVLRA